MCTCDSIEKAEQEQLLEQICNLIYRQDTRHIRINESRSDTIDGDIATPNLAREGACHTCHTGLCCRIISLSGISTIAYHRAYVDDTTPARFHHGANGCSAQAKYSA